MANLKIRWIEGWIGWMDRQMDRWMDGDVQHVQILNGNHLNEGTLNWLKIMLLCLNINLVANRLL